MTMRFHPVKVKVTSKFVWTNQKNVFEINFMWAIIFPLLGYQKNESFFFCWKELSQKVFVVPTIVVMLKCCCYKCVAVYGKKGKIIFVWMYNVHEKIKKNVYNDVEYFSTKYRNHTKMLAILEPKFKVKKEPISYVST